MNSTAVCRYNTVELPLRKFNGSDSSNICMNILFVQSRYHSNQHPIVKELVERGRNVKYLTRHNEMSETENYQVLEPEVLGYSSISVTLTNLFRTPHFLTKSVRWPPIYNLYREFDSFQPDIVISRDYSVYSLLVLLMAKLFNCEFVLYTQIPKYKTDNGKIIPKLNWLYQVIFREPLVRFTPVKGNKGTGTTSENIYYIPFVVDPEYIHDSEKKTYFQGNKINIISVGQYSLKRKKHILLLHCINELRDDFDISLTIVGHLEDETDKNYQSILNYIEEKNLESITTLEKNMEYEDLQEEYFNHDLYVLPSEYEPAAVSHLEAMAQGIPVICSDTNGTRWYINEGKNGYIFKTNNKKSLKYNIEKIISDKNKLIEMGAESRRIIKRKHLPKHFCDKFEDITDSFEN